MSISVVINTYNAEKHLGRVLESVKGFDEVVVCDMESTDRTLAIAAEYGCRVVTFEKRDYNIVEPARNFAIQSATHEWVLVVDADELVTPALRDYLYQQTALPHPADGIYIPRRNFFMGRFMHASYPDYQLRFFRKSKTYWPPVIHKQAQVDGKVIRAPKSQKMAFEHQAEDTISSRLRKMDVYADNEMPKRAGQKVNMWTFFARTTFRFFKYYIQKRGFLDGMPGFIYAYFEAAYQVIIQGKLLENRNKAAK